MNNIFEILKQSTTFESVPSNIHGAGVSEDIIITQAAMDQLIEAYNASGLEQNLQQAGAIRDELLQPIGASYFVRLFMRSTVDKSKQYNIKFDNKLTDFDNVYPLGKIDIAIDRKSLFYFLGVVIDYVKTDTEEGFVFLDTSDPKVSDYYLFKAQGQEWLDYVSATGKSILTSDRQDNYAGEEAIIEESGEVLYQDEMYEESEDVVEGNVTETSDEDTTVSSVLELEEAQVGDVSIQLHSDEEVLDAISTDSEQTNDLADTADNLSGEVATPVPEASRIEIKELQDLDVPLGAPADKTKVAQKRTITGIHFQD